MFELFEPKTIDEAFLLFNKYGAEAKILAGGTDLLVNMRQKAVEPHYVINIKRLPFLSFIEYNKKAGLKIGPLTLLHEIDTHSTIRSQFTAISEAAHEVGSLQIRNMGTIGGNICQDRKCVYYNQSHIDLFMRQSLDKCWTVGGSICHAANKDNLSNSLVGVDLCWASCCSDMLTALVCFNASIEIKGPGGLRNVLAEDFWPGPDAGKTVLDSNELITGIYLPDFPGSIRSIYLKYRRDSREVPIISVSARANINTDDICVDARIVLGGVAPVPLRAKEVEDSIMGKPLEQKVIEEAVQILLKAARSRGPATEFKIIKTRALVKDALNLLSKQ